MARMILSCVVVAWLLVAPPAALGAADTLRITHGVASGDVTSSEAVIWVRGSIAASMIVEYTPTAHPVMPLLRIQGPRLEAKDDFIGKVVLRDLAPDTRYLYWVRLTAGAERVSEAGSFKTAPADGVARPVSFVLWGDLGGQGYCRDPERGYALFTHMAQLAPDFAIANGDSVYADGVCPSVTSLPDHPRNVVSPDPAIAFHQLVSASDPRWKSDAALLVAYRAKWKYNLEDEPYRRFRAHTAHLYQWDDHEVMNDWSPGEEDVGALRKIDDPRPMRVFAAAGRRAFFVFTPIRPAPDGRIYRSARFGTSAEIFILDVRSYRDGSIVPDGAGTAIDVRLPNGQRRRIAGKDKSILGRAQREWLLNGLRDAHMRGVLWKIISTDDPLSMPTGSYPLSAPEGAMTPLYTLRDGWAAGPRLNSDTDGNHGSPLGFESELRALLAVLKAENITNVVWVATDVHVGRLLRYEPGGELAGLVFHEIISGPTSAGTGTIRELSPTFGPVELFGQGRRPDPARPSFFNFAYVRIGADGVLHAEIRDADGAVARDQRGRPGVLTLTPVR